MKIQHDRKLVSVLVLTYFVSLFRLKWVRKNQRILLLLGTKMETASDINIQA